MTVQEKISRAYTDKISEAYDIHELELLQLYVEKAVNMAFAFGYNMATDDIADLAIKEEDDILKRAIHKHIYG